MLLSARQSGPCPVGDPELLPFWRHLHMLRMDKGKPRLATLIVVLGPTLGMEVRESVGLVGMIANHLASFFVDGPVECIAPVLGVRLERCVDHGCGRDRADGVKRLLEVDHLVDRPAGEQRAVLGFKAARQYKRPYGNQQPVRYGPPDRTQLTPVRHRRFTGPVRSGGPAGHLGGLSKAARRPRP